MAFWRTYYHLVWATKKREPFITDDFESRLHDYLVQKAKKISVRVSAINGMPEHIHLIASIPPKLSVSEVVKTLKGASSHDFNQDGHTLYWQRGYGVLTLGENQREFAEKYVRNQKEHHANQSTNSWLERTSDEDEGVSDATPEER